MLNGDGTGLALVTKRLHDGKFRWPRPGDGVMKLSAAQASALVEGLDWSRVHVPRVPKPLALQRKNALFAGHQFGAENWAAIASLVETCKLNAIDPNTYLADVHARVVHKLDGDPLDDLLPANWVNTNAARAAFETSTIAQTA